MITVMLLTLLFSSSIGLAASQEITFLHTNNTQGQIKSNVQQGKLGFEKLATLVNKLKKQSSSNILVDAGNTLGGSKLAEKFKGEGIVKIMNNIGYDALLAGKEELSYGYYQLLYLNQLSDFPILSANLAKEGKLILDPYTIIEVEGTKVGILGLTSPMIKSEVGIEGLDFGDPIRIAQQYIPELKKKSDVVVALTNLGSNVYNEYNTIKLAKKVPEFDLIIDQANEAADSNYTSVEGTLIAFAKSNTKALGKANLTLEGRQLQKIDSELIEKQKKLAVNSKMEFLHNFYSNSDYNQPALDIKKLESSMNGRKIEFKVSEKALEELRSKENKKSQGKITKDKTEDNKSKEEKNSKKVSDQKEKSASQKEIQIKKVGIENLIADAIAEMVGTDLVLINSDEIKRSKQEKKVTVQLPDKAKITVMQISGAKLRKCLETVVASYPEGEDEFIQVAGINLKFDANKPSGERIIYTLVEGKELNPEAKYKVAFNSSILDEGNRYSSLLKNAPTVKNYEVSLKQAIRAYIEIAKENNSYPEVTGKIKKVDVKEQVRAEYVVQAGDTLWSIAQKYDISVERLAEFNQLSDSSQIITGQTIYIPND